MIINHYRIYNDDIAYNLFFILLKQKKKRNMKTSFFFNLESNEALCKRIRRYVCYCY